jgi:hypothetical protein
MVAPEDLIDGRVSVIVRIHDPARLEDLDLCLFSITHQNYSDIEVVVCCQNFDHKALCRVHELVGELSLYGRSARVLDLQPGRGDHRSQLLNAGLEVASGRYLTFLDFDDVVYGGAYSYLIERLRSSQTALAACGGVLAAEVRGRGYGRYVEAKHPMNTGGHRLLFFNENLYPIHSVMLDRSRIDPQLLRFDENLRVGEDYLFFLRIFVTGSWIDQRPEFKVGEYSHHEDGSNTIVRYRPTHDWLAESRRNRRYLDAARDRLTITLPMHDFLSFVADTNVSSAIAQQGGAIAHAQLLLRSKSWRLTRPFRALAHRLNFIGPDPKAPGSEDEAVRVIAHVTGSASFAATFPFRLVGRLLRKLGVH